MKNTFQLRKFNHPQNRKKLVERLLEKYHKENGLIIGFDFDHTIFDYHNEGGDYSCVIDLLKVCSELGFTMCLWTTEPNEEKLSWKIDYCKELGIKVDYVNESPVKKFKHCVKPYFNILLDDISGLEEAYYILGETIEKIISLKD